MVWSQQAETAPQAFAHAAALHQAGDFEGAIREYRVVLAIEPANFEALSNLGAALAHTGHYEEAIAAYQQALQEAPPDATSRLRMNLALGFYKSGRIAEAVRTLEVVRQQLPDDLQVTMLTADCYLRLGDLAHVIELLSPIAPSRPGDRAIAYMLGLAFIRSGQVEKGQALVDPILRESDSAEAHFLLGSVVFMAKDYPNSVKEFATAVSVNPDLPSLQSYYGQALLFTGDPEGASQAFRKALATDPNDYDSNLRLAEILLQRRQFAEARPLYERALRVHPGSAEAANGLAELDIAEGHPDQARERLEAIVAQSPRYADAHRTLARAAEQLGRKSEAARERAAAAKLESGPGGIPPGSPAPDFSLATPSGNGRIRLSDFKGRKPVVLVLGSYTCPQFRFAASALNGLYDRYGDRAEFLLVYIREAHGTGSWQSTVNQREGIDLPDPASFERKREYASSCLRKLNIKYTAVVDSMDNITDKAWSAWPSHLYVIDKQGNIVFNSLLDELNFDAVSLEAAIRSSIDR